MVVMKTWELAWVSDLPVMKCSSTQAQQGFELDHTTKSRKKLQKK
jgi:hypothetical protein